MENKLKDSLDELQLQDNIHNIQNISINLNSNDIFLTSPLLQEQLKEETKDNDIETDNNKTDHSNILEQSNNNEPKILNENLFAGRGFRSNKEEFEKKMSLKIGSSFTVESSLMSSMNLSFYDDNYTNSFTPVIKGESGYDISNIGNRKNTKRFKNCIYRNTTRIPSAKSLNINKRNILAPINTKSGTLGKSIDLKKMKETQKNFQK